MKDLRTARQRAALGTIAGFALLVTQCAVAQSEAAPQWDGDGIIEPGEDEVAELARAAQNPIASMISVPFQNNTNLDFGPLEKTQNVLNIQPVYPIDLSENWNLVTRAIFPVVTQPGFVPGQSSTTGLGDTAITAFFSPKAPAGKWIWGAGPVALVPTATSDRLGFDEWGVGGSFVALTMRGPWVIGSLFSNVWDVSADSGDEINLFTWQYFVNYNFPSGWYLTSSPIITANWEASSDNRWTIPFGGGFGKIFNIGRQPVNVSLQYYHNVEKPNFGADSQWRFVFTLLYPK